MRILKGICYLVAAIAVLTAILTGAAFVAIVGILFGIMLNIVTLVIFIANGLRAFFENRSQ